MRVLTKIRILPILALMIVLSAFIIIGTITAYAAAPEDPQLLTVDEVWLTGDTLHIVVTDSVSGETKTLELDLSEYALPGDEYVTIQATDSSGRVSNSIQFRNPYYIADSGQWAVDNEGNEIQTPSESSQPSTAFTPDGTGTVLDNVTDGDGKEFFTVETRDGNVFYLIVDRQRNTENVYLLNAVTEDDLASLAKPGDGRNTNVIGAPASPTPTVPPATTPGTEPTPAPKNNSGGNTGTIALVVVAVLAAGGIGYYIKIVRPKRNGSDDEGDYDEQDYGEDSDETEELKLNDNGEEDDEE